MMKFKYKYTFYHSNYMQPTVKTVIRATQLQHAEELLKKLRGYGSYTSFDVEEES